MAIIINIRKLGLKMATANSSTVTIFANPKCITAWRAEAHRVARRSTRDLNRQNAQYVQSALSLLDELYCLQNPKNINPLEVRQAAFAMFLEASLTGDPLAMFFEGLARKEGFGCDKDTSGGQALIRVAGMRKCAEAVNYLALGYCTQDVVIALSMFRFAAHDGHVQALSNFRQLAENVRIQIRRKRKIVEISSRSSRPRMYI